MKKPIIRILAVLFAAAMMLSIAACGDVSPADTTTEPLVPEVTTGTTSSTPEGTTGTTATTPEETTGTTSSTPEGTTGTTSTTPDSTTGTTATTPEETTGTTATTPEETTGTTATTPEETTGTTVTTPEETTPAVTTPEERLAEIAKAVDVSAAPPTSVKEIPLLVILANFDADGDGENDFDPDDPKKLFTEKSQKCYGEQWASTKLTDHYDKYFGNGLSLTNYYKEISLGAFRFVPLEFDKKPENSPVPNGMVEVTVPIGHPTATGDAQGAITKVFSACDEYFDFSKLDKNDNGIIDSTELGVIILNPGADASSSSKKSGQQYNPGSPRNYFEVWGTSQSLSAYLDDVRFSKVSNVGEYKVVGTILPVGVPVHELAHNLGTEDLYDRKINVTGGAVSGWPQPYQFSLQCNGNQSGGGATPTYLDPYQRIKLGWAEEEVVGDGVYTIHSTVSGKYKVLRVNTPDPDEYYLIEVRLKEGFERNLTSGISTGGIMVWHIDEGINRSFYASGMACSSYANSSTKKRHDPGIVPLFRDAFDERGMLMKSTSPADPFYYFSEEGNTSVCDTGFFCSPTNGTQGLNSYPKSWQGAQNYNLRIEVLSEVGESMTVKITGSEDGRKNFAPILSATYSDKSFNSITVMGKVSSLRGATITKCGVIFSTTEDFSAGVTEKTATFENGSFTALFDGLTPETNYYYKVYIEGSAGRIEAVDDTKTSAIPPDKVYANVSLYSDSNARAFAMKVNYGTKLVIPDGWLRTVLNKKPGNTIEGWYYDKELTKPFDFDSAVPAGTADFSLYAKWAK